jgi:Divergent InlB B-repeat domain
MRIAVPNTERKTIWLGIAVAAVAVVAATGAFGATNDSTKAATTRDRTMTDMPDDISGPQVHFLYVVPSDGADAQLDTNGGMEQSIARIERWLVTQTKNQGLRVDTYNGVPDIAFVRLPHSDAQATAANPWPLWVIGEDLVAAGFNDPAKVYAAFYDGHSTWACGGAYSPALRKLGAMYLQAQPTNDSRPCRDAPGFGTGTDRPGYFEIGLLHEILHVIGFTPRCAPHQSADGYGDHVNDSPTDLMYAPDAKSTAGWDWANAVLDFNHDDYYRANIPGCPDLSNSPYLAALHSVSVTVSGPGTVTSSPAGIDCPGICTGMFQGSVTLMAIPSQGAVFKGWTGACSGTATCVVTGEGSASASFSASSHRRTLTLRVRAQRATGALRVVDGYEQCRERAPVIIERRGGQGWSIIRRARTDRAGLFAVPIPKGRAMYRASAPETIANGQICVKAVSRTVSPSV